MTVYEDSTMRMALKQYEVVGRKLPTPNNPKPPTFKMNLYVKNEVIAASRFWYHMRGFYKMKSSTGEILKIREVTEPTRDNAANFGIFVRFDSNTGTHNMYKEFRDITKVGAISSAIQELNGCHRAKMATIQILGVTELADDECKKNRTKEFHAMDLKFPITNHKKVRSRQEKKRFVKASKC